MGCVFHISKLNSGFSHTSGLSVKRMFLCIRPSRCSVNSWLHPTTGGQLKDGGHPPLRGSPGLHQPLRCFSSFPNKFFNCWWMAKKRKKELNPSCCVMTLWSFQNPAPAALCSARAPFHFSPGVLVSDLRSFPSQRMHKTYFVFLCLWRRYYGVLWFSQLHWQLPETALAAKDMNHWDGI